jgi:hypothetical protein
MYTPRRVTRCPGYKPEKIVRKTQKAVGNRQHHVYSVANREVAHDRPVSHSYSELNSDSVNAYMTTIIKMGTKIHSQCTTLMKLILGIIFFWCFSHSSFSRIQVILPIKVAGGHPPPPRGPEGGPKSQPRQYVSGPTEYCVILGSVAMSR